MTTPRIGITGAAGYIGSRLCVDLMDAGYEVVPVDNFAAPQVRTIRGRTIHEVDVRDRDALRESFADVDAVCHLAAISDVGECDDRPETAFDTNVIGTQNVAWLCHEAGHPMIYPCSMQVIGEPSEFPITAEHPREPTNYYGRTKAMGEADVHALAEGSFPAHVFIKSNLYGYHNIDGDAVGKRTVINIFVERALDRKPLTVHKPGTQARDFVHVRDVARAYRLSLDRLLGADTQPGAITFPVASGECLSVLELAELVQTVTREERGYEPEIELIENPRDADETKSDFVVDTGSARERIGFEPEYTVERAVREMIAA